MKIRIDERTYEGSGTEIMDQLRRQTFDPTEYPDVESYICAYCGVEEVPALLLFLCREGLAIDGGCTGLPGSLGGDAILVGPLGHLGEEFLPGPHGEGLDGFFVHGDSLL